MSDDNTIIDFDKKDVPENVKPKRGKLILSNLSDKQKKMITNGNFAIGGTGITSLFYEWFNPGYKNAEEAIKDSRDIPEENMHSEQVAVIYTEACFADAVNDSMSFQEAFGTARGQMGPGGFFEWKGNIYNTYYKDEWDAMNEDQHQEYCESIENSAEYNTLELRDNQVIITEEGARYIDLDNDGNNEIEISDTDDDGHPDIRRVDLNDDGEWDIEHVKPSQSNENPLDEKPDLGSSSVKPNTENDVNNLKPNDFSEPENIVGPVTGIGDFNMDLIPDAIVQDINHGDFVDVIVADIDHDSVFESTFINIHGDINLDVIIIDEDHDNTTINEELDGASSLGDIDRPFSMDELIEINENIEDISNNEDENDQTYPQDDFEDDADLDDFN